MTDMQLTLNSTISRNDDVLFSEVADGMSLMDIDSGQYFHYDQTGAEIWKAIDDGITVKQLCTTLTDTFEVDAETCQNDTLVFVNELAGLGLLKAG